MRSAKTTRCEGIVLKSFDYSEKDKILTLYTPDLGKVHAIAKGIRRTTSRMGGHLDLFAHASVLLVHGRNMEIVTQGQARHTFPRLRDDLSALARACYIAELVDRFTEEGNPNRELFRALARVLTHIAAERPPDLAMALFQLQLLALSGYRPQLHRCVTCEAQIQPGTNAFDPGLGGVLCPACAPAHATAVPLSDHALKILRNLQTRGEAMFSISTPESAREEVDRALSLYTQYLLERRPSSAAFLEMLQRIETV